MSHCNKFIELPELEKKYFIAELCQCAKDDDNLFDICLTLIEIGKQLGIFQNTTIRFNEEMTNPPMNKPDSEPI